MSHPDLEALRDRFRGVILHFQVARAPAGSLATGGAPACGTPLGANLCAFGVSLFSAHGGRSVRTVRPYLALTYNRLHNRRAVNIVTILQCEYRVFMHTIHLSVYYLRAVEDCKFV
eukprot:2257572-Prymnesium_polylepis.1